MLNTHLYNIQEKENLERSNSRLDTSASESNRLLKTVTEEYENARTKLTEVERANERLRKDYNYVKVCLLVPRSKLPFVLGVNLLYIQNLA